MGDYSELFTSCGALFRTIYPLFAAGIHQSGGSAAAAQHRAAPSACAKGRRCQPRLVAGDLDLEFSRTAKSMRRVFQGVDGRGFLLFPFFLDGFEHLMFCARR